MRHERLIGKRVINLVFLTTQYVFLRDNTMKFTPGCLLIIFLLVFGFSTQALAIGLKCDTRLITFGHTKSKVISECGLTDYKEEWEEERIMRDFHSPAYYKDEYEWNKEPFLVKSVVKIEEWYYNFGRTRLTHYLRFRNGKLIKITIGEHGY
jgi:hypothetical protein